MFQIPKNVMQIGQSNPHCKIYVEDYVHTFLKQRPKEEIYFAFGKKEEVDGILYYLIYGAEKKTDWDRGSMPYFKKYERLGTLEGSAEKRVFRPVRQEAMTLDGYFVFYEQNEDMQSYMITVREKEEMQQEREAEKEAVMEAVKARREAGRELRQSTSGPRKINESQQKSEKTEQQNRQRQRQSERRMKASLFKKRIKAESTPWSAAKICRVASLVLVAILAVTGTASVKDGASLKAAGEFLVQSVQNLHFPWEDQSAETLNDNQKTAKQQGHFIIEETQLKETENTEKQNEEDTPDKIQWTIGQENADAEDDESQAETAAQTDVQPAEAPQEEIQPAETPQADIQPLDAQQAEIQPEAVETLSRPESYVVKRGDSLAEICRRFYGDTSRLYEICNLNKIADPNQIQQGQNILLP